MFTHFYLLVFQDFYRKYQWLRFNNTFDLLMIIKTKNIMSLLSDMELILKQLSSKGDFSSLWFITWLLNSKIRAWAFIPLDTIPVISVQSTVDLNRNFL